MTIPKRGHCSNRDVVNVNHKLYSPRYDYEGDDGRAWSEVFDSDAMCFWGICNHNSYNAWVKATDTYISEKLEPYYKKVLSRANTVYGGAAFPLELSDSFNDIVKIINDWHNAGYSPTKTWKDDFRNPFGSTWAGEVRDVIDHFDAAACAHDELATIAIEDLDQPSIAEGAPVRQLEHVEGGYLGGSGHAGRPGSSGSKVALAKAVGIVAVGAAGYFGYKVLTE